MGVQNCSRCGKPLVDESDILWLDNKMYCPTCYGNLMQEKPTGGQLVGWILGAIICICSILLLISYFIV